jgi:two-component system osmolarity sensor histidine kinase EnvZ
MIGKLKRLIKDLLPRTLLARSLLILVTPLFLVQIITTYMFFDRHWQKMVDRMAFSVAGEIAMIADQLDADHSAEELERIKRMNQKSLELTLNYVPGAILDKFYREDSDSFQNAIRENVIARTLADAFDHQVKRAYNITVDSDEKWVVVSFQLSDGVLVVTLPERRIFSSSGYVVLLWMLVSSIVLLIIAVLFMRNQIRPIRRLAIAAERFGKGRDVPFFKVEGAREVRQAARAFIDMKDRLQRQIQQRTAMLAGVSHDLRTPLTRMKLQLEMMGGQDAKDLKSDLADMERMIEAYLQFARGDGNEEPVRTDLSALVERIARANNRDDHRVYVEGEKDVSLLLRPVAFERCMNNLITNAVKYGTSAWVSVQRFGENVEIRVDDDGPGVDPAHYDDVFKPFYRGEASRNTKTGGVGLGLPIAQDIVLAHGGRIWLDRSPQGGLRVVVDLPV